MSSLSDVVLGFEAVLKRLVKVAATDWSPPAPFVAVGEFERVGTWMEVMDWEQYTEFMTRWASSSMGFDTVLRWISGLPSLVYLELEERHTRPGGISVVNSLSVFEFTPAGKIRHLDVYLRQPR